MEKLPIKENPFLFGKVVLGNYFVNRQQERKQILLDVEQHTNIILFSPRRYGKTSLVLQVFNELKKKHKNFAGFVIDFYTLTSEEKFLIQMADQYTKNVGLNLQTVLQKLKQLVSGITPVISLDALGRPQLDIQFSAAQLPVVFDEIVNLPQTLAQSGKLVAVFLDEFQEIKSLNGQDFQKRLRAIIQNHDKVSYIFSGSKQHLFQTIFRNSNNPLYRIGKEMSLKPIPFEEYQPFLMKHLKKLTRKFTPDHALRIYQIAEGITYYVQMLAHEVFNLLLLNRNQEPDLIIDVAVQNILDNKKDEFLFWLDKLSASGKIALEMICKLNGQGLFKRENLQRFQMAPSTLRKAIDNLIKEGIVHKVDGVLKFEDVFFKRWLDNVL